MCRIKLNSSQANVKFYCSEQNIGTKRTTSKSYLFTINKGSCPVNISSGEGDCCALYTIIEDRKVKNKFGICTPP